GLASTYDNPDLIGDVMMRGCFTKTLSQGGKQRPLLWQHDAPIGVVDLTDDPEGLLAQGTLSMDVQAAREAYSLMRDGAVRGLSIGFQTVRESFQGETRQLAEVKLFEVSLTALPCNEKAVVTSIKTAQQKDRILGALQNLRVEVLGALQKR